MTVRRTIGWLGAALLLLAPCAAAAQDVTAEVRTWSGQSWKLAQPSIEVFFTIVPPKDEGGPSGGGAAGGETAITTGGAGGMRVFGSPEAVSKFLDKGPEPRLGHRRTEALALRQGDVETRVPFDQIASLIFTRKPVRSGLPPHLGSQYRYGATAVLVDGSRVEGDYVNLGTMVLRGAMPQGRVDIPWHDIEVVRFNR